MVKSHGTVSRDERVGECLRNPHAVFIICILAYMKKIFFKFGTQYNSFIRLLQGIVVFPFMAKEISEVTSIRRIN